MLIWLTCVYKSQNRCMSITWWRYKFSFHWIVTFLIQMIESLAETALIETVKEIDDMMMIDTENIIVTGIEIGTETGAEMTLELPTSEKKGIVERTWRIKRKSWQLSRLVTKDKALVQVWAWMGSSSLFNRI